MSVNNQNARALRIMERIQAKTGLTENGKIALTQLINPFTDFSMPRAGFYDSDESSSVIQCIKYSKVISAPTGTAGNWDCHVFNTPHCDTHSIIRLGSTFTGQGCVVTFANNIAGGIADVGADGFVSTIGPVTCVTGPSGANLSLALRTPTTTVCSAAGLGPPLDSPYVQGVSRLIGIGFEVHNTTAEIQKQGSVAVYRSPQTHMLDRQCRSFLTATGSPGAVTLLNESAPNQYYTYNDVPGQLAQVLAFDGSRQWEARDGAMCVPSLVDGSIPVSRYANVIPICVNTLFPVTITTPSSNGGSFTASPSCMSNYGNLWCANVTSTQNTEVLPLFSDHKTNQFNTTGAFFTGLSNSTTLVVNTIYYFERFPSTAEADLVVMAFPSPSEDRIARELYSLIMREMPVACKVGDNADGDWFFEGLSSVLKFIDPVVKNLPMGNVLSPASHAISSWADNKVKERNTPGHSWEDQSGMDAAKVSQVRKRKPKKLTMQTNAAPKPKAQRKPKAKAPQKK